MTKYKLLKDFLNLEAGELLEVVATEKSINGNCLCKRLNLVGADNVEVPSILIQNTLWFEPITEQEEIELTGDLDEQEKKSLGSHAIVINEHAKTINELIIAVNTLLKSKE